MVVPEGIAAGSAESAIATPERQNHAIKSATSLMITYPAPALHQPSSTGQLDWQSDAS